MVAKVYKLSIGAACALEWPSERFVIQVLDDSTDPVVKVRTYAGDLTAPLFLSPRSTFSRRSSWPGHSEQTNHASNGKDRHANGTRVSRLRGFCSYVRVFL